MNFASANNVVIATVIRPHVALVTINQSVTAATELASEICANAPIAVRESLRVTRQCFDLTDEELRELSEAAQVRVMQTEDFHEGPKAFIEKREPSWHAR
jgi:enoyl-CoA hydratase/carnithine racemase